MAVREESYIQKLHFLKNKYYCKSHHTSQRALFCAGLPLGRDKSSDRTREH
jgi:hypothetical protein